MAEQARPDTSELWCGAEAGYRPLPPLEQDRLVGHPLRMLTFAEIRR
jgi:hypothetical protein